MCKILLDVADKSFCLKIDFTFYSNVLFRGSLADGGWLASTSSLVCGAVWFLVMDYFKHFVKCFIAVFKASQGRICLSLESSISKFIAVRVSPVWVNQKVTGLRRAIDESESGLSSMS